MCAKIPLCPILFGSEIENVTLTHLNQFFSQRIQAGLYCFNRTKEYTDLCELVSFAGGSPQILHNIIDDLVSEEKLHIWQNSYLIDPDIIKN